MAFRMSLVYPSGARLAGRWRWPHGPVTLQSTKLRHLSASMTTSNQYCSLQFVIRQHQHYRASSTTSLTHVQRTNLCAMYMYIPQSNNTSMRQSAYPMLQVFRSYSNGASENSKATDSKSNVASSSTAAAAGQSSGDAASTAPAQSSAQRVKIILREYGTVAVVFHISMSLCVLSVIYILVSNGLDVDKVLDYFNVETSTTKKGASTFAISYLLYKMLLPIRATITIACVPIIVRSLRARGWMKGVAKAPTK